MLAPAGAAVTADGTGTLTVSGLTAGQVVALLSAKAVPFSEVSAHHATLEQAYLELTRDAAEYRAADAMGRPASRPVTAHRCRAGLPRPPGRRWRDDRHDHAARCRSPRRARRLRPAAPLRVDQVPHRPRLGHQHAARRPADHRGQLHPWRPMRRHAAKRPDKPGRTGLRSYARADRPGSDRQLLFRASADDRQRQHHGPGDVA